MPPVPEMDLCQGAYFGVLADNGLSNLWQTSMSVIIKKIFSFCSFDIFLLMHVIFEQDKTALS